MENNSRVSRYFDKDIQSGETLVNLTSKIDVLNFIDICIATKESIEYREHILNNKS